MAKTVLNLSSMTFTYIAEEGSVILALADDVFSAHWDSGQPDTRAVRITEWDGKTAKFSKEVAQDHEFAILDGEVVDYTHPGYFQPGAVARYIFRYVAPAVNATPEDVERYEAAEAVKSFLKYLSDAATAGHFIVPTQSHVEVVRGRKVPRGLYEVITHRIGQYGPYVDLRDASGKYFRYVSVGNVLAVPDYARAAEQFRFLAQDETTLKFFLTASESHFADRMPWLVLADYIQEHDWLPVQVDKNVVSTYFAEYLRQTEQPIKIDQYSITRQRDLD